MFLKGILFNLRCCAQERSFRSMCRRRALAQRRKWPTANHEHITQGGDAMAIGSRSIRGFGVFAFALLGSAVFAHTPEQPPHQSFSEGDLKLESGEVIKDFSISYVTHGTLNEKKNNAILMTSSIGGNHHRIDFLIGPGKALDTNKYFIIATDAIGNGLSTSPSNSKTQQGTAFPHF